MPAWHRRTYAALALCVAVALAAVSGVFANAGVRFVVDSTTDAVDSRVGDGACRTLSGSCTLRAAIQEANALPGADHIQVPAGTYELGIPPLNQNDVTTGDLDITDSLTISGAGAGATIVDGGSPPAGAPPDVHGLDRLFEVSVDGGTAAFSGVTVRDGYTAEHGGAIANNSTASVSVSGADLTGNVADKSGGALDNHLSGSMDVRDSTLSGNFAYENGSALNNNRDGALTVTGSTISANSAAAVGLDEQLVGAGAISNNAELDMIGTITVTQSRISDNRAGGGRSGATLTNDGAGTVIVDDTSFTKNRATGDGGAIFNGAGDVTVTDSAFSENAANDGGAIYNSVKDGRVTVSGSTFSLNAASGRGGAIAGGGTGSVVVSDSAFAKNSAEDWGGAVLNDDKGSTAIHNSSFSENSGLNGGGFANDGTGLVTIENSNFTKNAALVTSALASGEGGGMHTNSVGEVVLTGGAFTENTARSGGGLSNEGGGTLEITGTRFSANHADEQGGGLLIQSGAVHMLNIDVIGNSADSAVEAGGGISYQGDKLVGIGETAAVEDSRIRDNKAKGPGGGIDSRGDGPLAVTTTAISGNTAAAGGGIHHVGDAPLELARSTLSGNFAESGGGVFTDGDGEATLENTTVSGNRAGQFGGGLLVSSRLTVESSTVADNTAASGGGINNGGGDLVGDGSVFLRNTIVANSPTGGNCMGTITSLGGNLESANSCQLGELSDQPGTNSRLGALGDNGGTTQTQALLAGSPAQERAVCTDLDPCPSVDQRGIDRPRFAGVDIGAYESELAPDGVPGSQPCAGRSERPVRANFDSWVKQATPGANFGNDSILKIKSQGGANERSLVHFALPPVPPGCKLVGATLRLHASAATEGGTLEALRVASGWDELGVTWENQPTTAGPPAATASGLGQVEWDVLDQTLEMYVHGDHGWLIRDRSENGLGEQAFHSTEKGADPPELVLVFDDPDAPPAAGTCPTSPQSLLADRDSWVSEGSPTNNFGTDSTLKVKSQLGVNARALVRFPLPALPSGCTGVASATLRLEAASAKDGRTLQALQVASAWTEPGVTWSNQPATTGGAATTPSAQGSLEWSVTDQLLDMYTSGNHGFLIRDAQENGVGDEQALHSRDKLSDGPPELVLAFDDSTPETVIDQGPPSSTHSAEATFTFSSDRDDASFECSLDGAAFRQCSSPHVVTGLSEADHGFEVRATRKIRAVDPTPARYDWKVAIPPRTTVAGPVSPSNSADATVTFSADDPEPTFECSLNGAAFERCTSPTEYTNLADGPNEVRVRATDPLGNVEPTPASHAWTVAVPPETTIDSGPPALGNSASASFAFSGTDNGPAPAPLQFECRLDAGEWTACSSEQRYVGLTDGPRTFEVRATDRAGNREAEPASRTWTIDTVAPETTIDAGPPKLVNSAEARFEFRADEASTFECRLDAGAWTRCASRHELAGLADGVHTFEVRATDRAGNLGGSAAETWTVDTVAPEATIDTAPPGLSKSGAATFEFHAGEAASFECRLDTGDWAVCESPYELTGLADGKHTFEVRATDLAGNVGDPATWVWTIDTLAPETSFDTAPADPSNDRAPRFEFSTTEPATVECKLDMGEWAVCTSPHDLTDLADGEHSLQARATDLAGNHEAEPAAHTWTVDTVAPDTTIRKGPPALSNSPSAAFDFDASEAATIECRLDEGEWAPCASGQSYTGLADGPHTFQVRATDQAGNVGDAASSTWTVDTVAPDTTIDTSPSDPSNDRGPRFEFHAGEEASFECQLDTGAWAPCSSGQTYTALADGRHTFQVRATDAAGNGEAQPASNSWTVDTVAPDTTIGNGPPALSNSASAAFEFGADETATLECQLDTRAWAACSGPQGYTGLADGEHTFRVQATDRAGNREAEPAAYTWTVDTVAPETTIDTAPSDLSNDRAPRFEFHAGEAASFECQLDAGAWAACSSPQGYAGLADGQHAFRVRATDRAGNLGAAASRTWTVDTVAPDTSIDRAPADPSDDHAASFEFSAPEAATFECKLDEGPWTGCSSPQSYTGLADGGHTFQVRATDRAGNGEVEPASYTWTIQPPRDSTPPETTITAQPANPSNSASATFGFAGTDNETAAPMIAFQCRLDSQAPADFGSCSNPKIYSGLSEGSHKFDVRALDLAGNADPTPATFTWTVDTTAPQTTITAAPPTTASSTSPSFGFAASESDSTFECSLDGAAFSACSSPGDYTGLEEGAHRFSVRAIDAARNSDSTPATFTWTVDTTPPQTTITAAPAAPTSSTSASFSFAASESGSTVECSLDGAAFSACNSPRDYIGLAVGTHQFSVRAKDAAGNTDATPATHTWVISAPQGCGPAATTPAAADTWIDENSPTNNKGDDSILKVQSKGPRDNFRALVRFALPAVPQGCVVQSATLRVYAASAKTGRTLHALRLASSWSENQVNWSNQPLTAGSAAATASGTGYLEWNVTSQLEAMFGTSNHGFLIRDALEGQDAEQQFHAREKGENPPQLVVRFVSAGG